MTSAAGDRGGHPGPLPGRRDLERWGLSDRVFEYNKRQIQPEDCSPFARQMFGFFNSAPALDFLVALTGIEGLLPDPTSMAGASTRS